MYIVRVSSSVCHTGESMYSRLKLFERRASREIFGLKKGTEKRAEKISCLRKIKNTIYLMNV
jgi:hypothetical protein